MRGVGKRERERGIFGGGGERPPPKKYVRMANRVGMCRIRTRDSRLNGCLGQLLRHTYVRIGARTRLEKNSSGHIPSNVEELTHFRVYTRPTCQPQEGGRGDSSQSLNNHGIFQRRKKGKDKREKNLLRRPEVAKQGE